MSKFEFGQLSQPETPRAVKLYCMATMVADEASREGESALAKSLENALDGYLAGLPKDLQRQALRFSYELALQDTDPAPPRLRLVYSRD